MDDHTRRVCASVVEAWTEFEAGRGPLIDVQIAASNAADALDNSSRPLPLLLHRAVDDLEEVLHCVPLGDQAPSAGQAMTPVLNAVASLQPRP